jgi:predicted AlkP superfamily phosphohydrolase/phosphomutase
MKDTTKLFVIGIDGATFDVMRPMLEMGELPTIKRLMDEGAYGDLESVPNMISPSAWTSFMTGKNPGKHGIYEFYEINRENYTINFINAMNRKAASLWRILSDYGFRVGVANVPMTYPAEKVNGFLICGLESPGPEVKGFSYPEGLYNELVRNCGKYIMEPGITSHVMAGRLNQAEELLYESIENRLTTTKYLMNNHSWDFFFVVFRETDPAQHCFWKYFDTSAPDYIDSHYSRVIPEVYRRIDRAIGEIIKGLPEGTNLIILSDHSFGFRQRGNLCLNNWLEKAGLLRFKNTKKEGLYGLLYRQVEKRFTRKTKEKLVRLFPNLRDKVRSGMLFSRIDWQCTKAFTDGIREGIYINLKGHEPMGVVDKEEYNGICDHIIHLLMEIRDAQTKEKVVEHVFRKEEVYHGEYIDKAPDLIIRWKPNAKITALLTQEGDVISPNFLTEEHKTISGDHRLYGIIILKGKGIKKGIRIQNARIIDVTPTILHMMEQPIPSDMDGKVLTEVFYIDSKVRFAKDASVTDVTNKLEPNLYGEDDVDAVRQRLRDLGYVE